ncbi:hypothetical protein AM587_10012600 [Phytophthora nicotianae]|uniref:Uncharacterized protein n=1 Tax=Phytophthora nicotianae TaxID=4792 RepID=A0A0W8C066_PHYNI|nr:hypothetical protein AM587_10012600 [Phytophthora nicotianae]
MEVTPTLDDAEALRQLMLADEHLMICLCGVDEEHDEDARALQEAVQKIVRIKKQMGGNERQATSSFRLLLVYRQVKKVSGFNKKIAMTLQLQPQKFSVYHTESVAARQPE